MVSEGWIVRVERVEEEAEDDEEEEEFFFE